MNIRQINLTKRSFASNLSLKNLSLYLKDGQIECFSIEFSQGEDVS